MDNDNSFEDELPEGRSVFGDDELPTGASVFGDVDADLPVDEVPIEAIENPSTSVFGDESIDDSLSAPSIDDSLSAPSIDDSLSAPSIDDSLSAPSIDDSLSAPIAKAGDVNIVSASNDVEHDLDAVEIDDGSDDPIDLLGDPVTEIPDETSDTSRMTARIFDDGITTGEAIALDVEPGDDDGLGAWSDLGTAAPAWGDADEAKAKKSHDSWDPGPVPDAEPAVVKIGASESERFFEFDDQTPEDPATSPETVVSSGSEMQSRIVTGVALLAIAVIGFTLGGPLVALAIITIVVALAAGEFYNALRVAGYQPATLLGLAATVAMPIAVYFRGTQAVAMILALAVVFGLIWYLAGVATEMPVMNLGVTLLGVVYIGVLGSFGAALLETANRVNLNGDNGTGMLLAAVILTVGYDVGAFFSGRSMGRTPLTKVSPRKTVEGLIGGAIMTVVVSVVFLSVLNLIEPFNTFGSVGDALILGIAAAIMAPLGDLGESLIKRDLGIKDMGTILPGHGGFLDRFDALLFVLPTVYFFSLVFFYG